MTAPCLSQDVSDFFLKSSLPGDDDIMYQRSSRTFCDHGNIL